MSYPVTPHTALPRHTKAAAHPHQHRYAAISTTECYADYNGYLCAKCAEGQLEFGEALPTWEDGELRDDGVRVAQLDLSACDPDLHGRCIERCYECGTVLIADAASLLVEQAYLFTQTDRDEWHVCLDAESQFAGYVQWHHTDACGIMWRVQIKSSDPDSATIHRALPLAGCWQYDALDGEPALSTILIGEQPNRAEAFDSLCTAMTDITLKNQPPLF